MTIELVTPSVQEVANQMGFRLKDRFNNMKSNFDGTTYPTDTQVAALITKASSDVELDMGTNITESTPQALRDAAKDLIILKTAMRIELSFFSEQVAQGLSPFQAFKDEYAEGIVRLDKSTEEEEQGNAPGPEDEAGNNPMGYFGDGVDCWSAGPHGYWIRNTDGEMTYVVRR